MFRPFQIKNIWFLLLIFLLPTCRIKVKDNNRDKTSNESISRDISIDDETTYSEQELVELIDEYGGHPGDPQLPNHILGVTNEVLESINPQELSDVINLGHNIAHEKLNSNPRLLFELARIANQIGYTQKSINWFNKAGDNGSIGAIAYLGFLEYENGNYEKARELIHYAVNEGGFQSTYADEILLEAEFDLEEILPEFNRKDIIVALYNGNISGLASENALANGYYLGTIHNTLWESDILFLVDNNKMLLELDSEVSVHLGSWVKGFKKTGLQNGLKMMIDGYERISGTQNEQNSQQLNFSLIEDHATQDARRLALLYDSSPEEFRKIYSGIKEFSRMELNIW